MEHIWYTGLDNYKKHIMEPGKFTMELLDVPHNKFTTVQDAFAAHLVGANLPVEVLYSGGLDSECIIVACLQKKIPVIAVTMKLLYKGSPFNTHDLYYAEKFCRANDVRQVFYELEISNFFEKGDHLKYTDPYHITYFNVPTHMWLIEQCHNFPIIGGDYSWPQLNIGKKVFSPHKHEFACYDIFMRDNGITGIGNMLSHSIDSNIFFAKEHITVHRKDPDNVDGDDLRIRNLKIQMLENLGFGKLELRHKSYGWEIIDRNKNWFDLTEIINGMVERSGRTKSIVRWGSTMGSVLETGPGENDSYGK